MQEVQKTRKQDFRADPSWSISSGKIESKPEGTETRHRRECPDLPVSSLMQHR